MIEAAVWTLLGAYLVVSGLCQLATAAELRRARHARERIERVE